VCYSNGACKKGATENTIGKGGHVTPTAEGLSSAVANAIGFFEESREPHALLWLAVMHRRFGVPQFADALQRYDRVLTEQPEQAPLRRVLRRFADRDNPLKPDDWDAVTDPSDRLLVCALYCDRIGLPRSFADMLHKAASAGGYYLPHVILVWFWIRENGCALTLPDGFMDRVYAASAAIIDHDPRIVSDLRLEVAAFLYLIGQGKLVNNVFAEHVLASQNADGGWGQAREQNGRSDWHSTVLGLLLLLQLR
jgi:hypothetical protein